MTVYLILFILATIGVAVIFNTDLSQNKLLKYGSVGLYFWVIEFLLYKITDDFTIPVILFAAIIIVALLILAIRGGFFISTKNRTLKYALSFTFLFVVFGITYILFESIMKPIRFEKEKEKRYIAAVQELMVIRKTQTYYKREHKKFSPNIEDLKSFILHDSITNVKKGGVIPDSIYLQAGNDLRKAEKIALERKIISRDTSRISVKDSLFKKYDLSKFGNVPYTKGLVFEMDTATVESGGVKIHVFEARISNLELLDGLDRQLILNLDDVAEELGKYKGLKVGSIEENNNNEGNWDKEIEVRIIKRK